MTRFIALLDAALEDETLLVSKMEVQGVPAVTLHVSMGTKEGTPVSMPICVLFNNELSSALRPDDVQPITIDELDPETKEMDDGSP